MTDLILGMAAAVAASTFYSLGVVLQAMDAKRAPRAEHLRLGLARDLLKRARWLAGTGISILGWPLQVVALLLVPLVVVQPTLAAGLLVLLWFGRRLLHEHAGRREHVAVAAIVLGVLGAALCAPPYTTTHSGDETITIVLGVLAVLATTPYVISAVRRPAPSITMIGAGLAFAWSGVATKLASDDLHHGHLTVAAAWAISTAGASAVGALSEMSALQMRPAIQVAPVVFVTQTVVPIVLAPLILNEKFTDTPLNGVALALALAILVAGAAALARSPLLLALMEGDVVSEPSGSLESPSERSQETIRSTPRSEDDDPSTDTTSTSPARIGR
jgi:drug/metabolite transporter (DMT)-like permease